MGQQIEIDSSFTQFNFSTTKMAFKYIVLNCLVVMASAGLLPAEQYTYSAPLTYTSHAIQAAPITYTAPITKYATPVSYEAPTAKVTYNAPLYEAAISKVVYSAPSYEAPITKVAYSGPSYEAPIAKVAYTASSYQAPITKVAYTAPSYEAPITKVTYAAPIARVDAATPAEKVEVESKAQYSYSYDVQDGHTGDSKSQHESRDGDVVRGSYSVVDPDGTKRTVDYTADPHNGFNAVVHKEPIAVKVAPVSHVAKIAAPVSYASAPIVHSEPVYQTAPLYQAAPVYQSYSAPAYNHH